MQNRPTPEGVRSRTRARVRNKTREHRTRTCKASVIVNTFNSATSNQSKRTHAEATPPSTQELMRSQQAKTKEPTLARQQTKPSIAMKVQNSKRKVHSKSKIKVTSRTMRLLNHARKTPWIVFEIMLEHNQRRNRKLDSHSQQNQIKTQHRGNKGINHSVPARFGFEGAHDWVER